MKDFKQFIDPKTLEVVKERQKNIKQKQEQHLSGKDISDATDLQKSSACFVFDKEIFEKHPLFAGKTFDERMDYLRSSFISGKRKYEYIQDGDCSFKVPGENPVEVFTKIGLERSNIQQEGTVEEQEERQREKYLSKLSFELFDRYIKTRNKAKSEISKQSLNPLDYSERLISQTCNLISKVTVGDYGTGRDQNSFNAQDHYEAIIINTPSIELDKPDLHYKLFIIDKENTHLKGAKKFNKSKSFFSKQLKENLITYEDAQENLGNDQENDNFAFVSGYQDKAIYKDFIINKKALKEFFKIEFLRTLQNLNQYAIDHNILNLCFNYGMNGALYYTNLILVNDNSYMYNQISPSLYSAMDSAINEFMEKNEDIRVKNIIVTQPGTTGLSEDGFVEGFGIDEHIKGENKKKKYIHGDKKINLFGACVFESPLDKNSTKEMIRETGDNFTIAFNSANNAAALIGENLRTEQVDTRIATAHVIPIFTYNWTNNLYCKYYQQSLK